MHRAGCVELEARQGLRAQPAGPSSPPLLQVLTQRTDNLKAHQERKSMFSAAPEAGPSSRQPLFGQPGGCPATPEHAGSEQSGDGASARPGVATECLRPIREHRAATMQQGDVPACGLHPTCFSLLLIPRSSAGASFLPPNARNPLMAQSGVRGGLQGGGSSESAPLLGGGGSGGQQAQALMAAPQDQYLSSRAEALHQVESTIVELGSIFQQLAHMVHEQGEMAMRIDENVDDALSNVDAGQAQLLKYLSAISSNRMLLLKVFAVLMAFMIFFIMFIA